MHLHYVCLTRDLSASTPALWARANNYCLHVLLQASLVETSACRHACIVVIMMITYYQQCVTPRLGKEM